MGQINVKKSIRTKTLNYNDSLWGHIGRWTERGLFYLLGTFFIFFPIKDMLDGLNTDNLPISRIIYDLIFLTIGVWLIYSLVNMDKLTVIKGTEKSINKDLMYDLLKDMFKDCGFYFFEEQLYGVRGWTMRIPGKEFTVLFDSSDIYINITHKVRFGDMDSPFHVLKNQADIKEIRKKILENTKTNRQQNA